MSVDVARRYHDAGLTVIPIADDGSKRPVIKWGDYRYKRPTEDELQQWFAHCDGLAVLGGVASCSLEILDFDDPSTLQPWGEIVKTKLPAVLPTLPISRTPSGGTHIFYRCSEISGNMKLAQQAGPDGRPQTRIETRGEGGYAVVPPTPARYHEAHKPYRMLRGDLCDLPVITPDDRATLLDAACQFNTYVAPEVKQPPTRRNPLAYSDRPGDEYNAKASWADVLQPYGWKCLRSHNGVDFWQRPGKKGIGCSATTGHNGYDVLYVFSSNAHPFEPGHGYTKFTAFALLGHGGDVSKAAKVLAQERREASVYVPERARNVLRAAGIGA